MEDKSNIVLEGLPIYQIIFLVLLSIAMIMFVSIICYCCFKCMSCRKCRRREKVKEIKNESFSNSEEGRRAKIVYENQIKDEKDFQKKAIVKKREKFGNNLQVVEDYDEEYYHQQTTSRNMNPSRESSTPDLPGHIFTQHDMNQQRTRS